MKMLAREGKSTQHVDINRREGSDDLGTHGKVLHSLL